MPQDVGNLVRGVVIKADELADTRRVLGVHRLVQEAAILAPACRRSRP